MVTPTSGVSRWRYWPGSRWSPRLAVGLALALQPEGLAVFAGLAALQLLMIFIASVPLVKELRQSGVGGPRDD